MKYVWLAFSLTSIWATSVLGQSPAQASATRQSSATRVRTPAQGSSERLALLDAVRTKLNIKSRFRVTHLMTDGGTAFFEGSEVVEAEGELQETDLSVLALMERRSSGSKERWEIVDLWTLHMPEEDARKDFVARLRKRVNAGTLLRNLLPDDLLDENGSR